MSTFQLLFTVPSDAIRVTCRTALAFSELQPLALPDVSAMASTRTVSGVCEKWPTPVSA